MPIALEAEGYTASVDPLGAQLRSFCDAQGTQYLWQADAAYWNESAPWLFPIVCDLRDNQTLINGQVYHMERHGFAKDLTYAVVERCSASVMLEAGTDERTLGQYPFPFLLRQRFTLRRGTLEMLTSLTNTGTATMPFCLGVHPGFRCPLFEGERFEDYRLVWDLEEDLACPTLNVRTRLIEPQVVNLRLRGRTLPLHHKLFANDALVLEHPRSRGVALLNPQGRGIRVEYPDYQSLGIWTTSAKDAPYLCIEPWNGTCDYADERGVLEEKRGVMRLRPNEYRRFCVRLTPICEKRYAE